jgi:hypothetical protein
MLEYVRELHINIIGVSNKILHFKAHEIATRQVIRPSTIQSDQRLDISLGRWER